MQKFIIIILILLSLFLGVSWWNSTIDYKKQLSTSVLNDFLMQKKILDTRDSTGRVIQVYQLQTITSEQLATSKSQEAQQLRKDLKIAGGKLNRVSSSATVRTSLIDTVHVSVNDTIHFTDTGLVTIPFTSDTLADTFNRVSGTAIFYPIGTGIVFKELVPVISVKGGTSLTYFFKGGFLKKSHTDLMITENNPKVTINKIQTYTVVNNKKWYEKWWVHIMVGSALTLTAEHFIK